VLLAVCLLERLCESFDFGCVYIADDQESQVVRLPGFDGEGVVSTGFGGSREGQSLAGRCLEDQNRDLVLAHGDDQLCAGLLMQIDDSTA